jgi:hypothetical protein
MMTVLGMPGRSGSAHVMQFGPVGIESGRNEVVPEGANPVKLSAVVPFLGSVRG